MYAELGIQGDEILRDCRIFPHVEPDQSRPEFSSTSILGLLGFFVRIDRGRVQRCGRVQTLFTDETGDPVGCCGLRRFGCV